MLSGVGIDCNHLNPLLPDRNIHPDLVIIEQRTGSTGCILLAETFSQKRLVWEYQVLKYYSLLILHKNNKAVWYYTEVHDVLVGRFKTSFSASSSDPMNFAYRPLYCCSATSSLIARLVFRMPANGSSRMSKWHRNHIPSISVIDSNWLRPSLLHTKCNFINLHASIHINIHVYVWTYFNFTAPSIWKIQRKRQKHWLDT